MEKIDALIVSKNPLDSTALIAFWLSTDMIDNPSTKLFHCGNRLFLLSVEHQEEFPKNSDHDIIVTLKRLPEPSYPIVNYQQCTMDVKHRLSEESHQYGINYDNHLGLREILSEIMVRSLTLQRGVLPPRGFLEKEEVYIITDPDDNDARCCIIS